MSTLYSGTTIDPVSAASSVQIETSILDSLLADTPPFAIGLLGFAVFTFFLISKKINLASLFLLSSVLLMFFGALADLGHLYLRHAYSTESPRPRAHTLKIIREILYSISSGLRFLFYWVFVSQPPFCEQDSAPFLSVHSGSWQRWGITGTFLRWATLATSLSVLVFQVLWRTVPLMHEFGPIYDIEGAVEITTSAIFIVKLILNVLLVEVCSRRQTLWQYSSVFSALFINMAIGIGNLMHFAFSEFTLGRLLLITEFQILLVSIMVFTFRSTKTAEGCTHPTYSKRASSFRGLNLSFYDSGPGLFDPNRTPQIQSRPPSAQSSSPWLDRDKQSRSPSRFGSVPAGKKRLGAEKRERELNTYPSEKTILSFAGDMIPDSAQSNARWDGPVYPSSVVNSFAAFPLPPAFPDSPSSPPLIGQFPVGSAYNAREGSSLSVPGVVPTGSESPVLGSDGISSTHCSSPPLRPLSNSSYASRVASEYDNLFREQIELERSIAALRGSTPFGRRDESQADRDTTFNLPDPGTARESSTTGNGHTSTSGKSEFSLSIFPEPPQMRDFEEDYRQSSSSSVLLPPRRISIFTAGKGFPTSNRSSEDVTTLTVGLRELSVGTHYDVTSFIGDLSSPEENLAHTPAQHRFSDTNSESGSAFQATIVTVERKTSIVSRPRLVTSPSLAIDISTSTISRSRGPDGPSIMETPVQRQFSPVSALLVSPPPAIYNRGVTISSPLRTPLTKRIVGLPSRTNPLADRLAGDIPDMPAPM